MLNGTDISDNWLDVASRETEEGILGEPITIIKTRANNGFPKSSLGSYSAGNTQIDWPNDTYQTSLLGGKQSYSKENFDDLDLDLHKLRYARPLDDFISKLKYEGVVLSVREDYFTARLHSLSHDIKEEIAEFSFEEISEDDKSLVKEGALFYWNIGYLIYHGGRKLGCHMINFRRLPLWSDDSINNADKNAEELLSWFNSTQD